MLSNYFKTAWRAIKSHKAYSIINIGGLTLGIASCLMIFLVVKYEPGYDGFFSRSIVVSLVIAGSTIAWQAIKAGVANPVKSLRSE